ncbi:hypothetical protein F9K91_04850 [Brucella tritici]|uniref:Uncharacterized protein n=1 Tax=Brucella tritici TaxID=94626 RepID=A0A833FNJ9_9HYPH|nr:hypothetical protein [Brucella tritici]KAB2666516.1 hypothetical protein F9K91_04850 [Brucella tritici]
MNGLLLRVAIGAALCFGIYFAGWNAHANVSRAGQYKAERDSALRSLALFEEAAEHAESLARDAKKEANEAKKRLASYAKSLPKNPACRLTDDDIKRLRDLRRKAAPVS